jgi:hypothetical protein
MAFDLAEVLKLGISATVGWLLARGSKQGDELRTLYTAWAAACHRYLLSLRAARWKAEGMATNQHIKIDESIRWIMADGKDWQATGIAEALTTWEQARFAITITDTHADYRQAVDQLTTKFQTNLSLHTSLDDINAAIAELKAFADTLRNRFKIKYWLDEITRD